MDELFRDSRLVKDEVKGLLGAMLEIEEKKRISWKGILDHPAIKSVGPNVKIEQEEKLAKSNLAILASTTDETPTEFYTCKGVALDLMTEHRSLSQTEAEITKTTSCNIIDLFEIVESEESISDDYVLPDEMESF